MHAQAAAKLSDATLRRRQTLLTQNFASQQDVDERTADLNSKNALVKSGQANVDRLEALASYKQLTAPFDGIVTARDTDVGALINAEATANYIREQNPDTVVLVASHPTGDEDVACAEYIRGLLGGEGISLEQARERTRNAFAAKKFLDGSHPRLRPQDIDMAASSAGPDALIMGVTYEPVPRIDVIRRAS